MRMIYKDELGNISGGYGERSLLELPLKEDTGELTSEQIPSDIFTGMEMTAQEAQEIAGYLEKHGEIPKKRLKFYLNEDSTKIIVPLQSETKETFLAVRDYFRKKNK